MELKCDYNFHLPLHWGQTNKAAVADDSRNVSSEEETVGFLKFVHKTNINVTLDGKQQQNATVNPELPPFLQPLLL